MLVGMLKNLSYYNPIRREKITKERRDVVLTQMRKAGHLTSREVDLASETAYRAELQSCRPRSYPCPLLPPALPR